MNFSLRGGQNFATDNETGETVVLRIAWNTITDADRVRATYPDGRQSELAET